MKPFQYNAESVARLDWSILVNGAISLYFRQDVLLEDIVWFKQNGYLVYRFDCSKWLSKELFHSDLMDVLPLPDYYGKNLDALNDCLIELDIPEEGGCVLQFIRFDLFAARMPNIAQDTLDILETTSRRFLLLGRRFIGLVQSDNPRISFDPVGACAVSWNPKEWLSSKRGV